MLNMLLFAADSAPPSLFLNTLQLPWTAPILTGLQFAVIYVVVGWMQRRDERQEIAAVA